jgi:predicted permease
MSMWRRLRYLLPFYRRAEERDMQEEFDALTAIAGGLELGNLTLAAENARAEWGWTWLSSVLADFRYAFRVLSRRPSFTAVAVLSLGLGIGANAAIFSLVDALLLRALPVSEPDRLVSFGTSVYSYYTFQRFKENSGNQLSGMLATTGAAAREIDTGSGAQRAYVELVTGDYFPLLGVSAILGRTIAPEDDQRGTPGLVAVISYRYWQKAFAGDPAILGRTIRVQKVAFTIVGVSRPEFFGVTVGAAPDVWGPLNAFDEVFPGIRVLDNPNANWFYLMGRLGPGVTAEQASSALTPLGVRIDLDRAGPQPEWIRKSIERSMVTLIPAGQGLSSLRRRFSKPLQVVFAMVMTGLIMACLNILSLQFARTDERRREISVRQAIGAGRMRILRQLLTEALVVAMGGGLIGLAICRPVAALLTSFLSEGARPVVLPLRIDSTLLLFISALSIVAALVCGIAPALRATREDPAPALQQSSRSATAAPFRRALGRAVTLLQFALSLVLVGAAFLFAFSLHKLTQFDTGVDRRRLVVVDVDAREAGYEGAELTRLNQRILERLSAVPGVASASFSGNGIYTGRNNNASVGADGFQSPDGPGRNAFHDQIGPRHFATIGTRLIAGREFDEHDNAAGLKVAIVNEAFARHFFAGTNPIGRNIWIRDQKQTWQVVGIVRDIWTDVRQAPLRYFYRPAYQTQGYFFSTRFLVRTRLSAEGMMGALRTAVRQEGSGLRIAGIDLADGLLDRTLDLDRLIAALTFGFGVLALVLAAVGVYGRLAYEVSRRTSEIGIRMALGASKSGVMRMVLGEVAIVATAGIAVGIAAGLRAGGLATSLVFEVQAADPRVLGAAAGVLAITAFGAAWLPARRAAQMDPMVALRNE